MGMFDEIRCKYPLPIADPRDVAGLLYQTKDTPAQFLDAYEIRRDGSLWHQDYDIEDCSDPKAKGLLRLSGMLTRVRTRWKRVRNFTGEIRFYTSYGEDNTGWIEFSSYFVRGSIKQMELLKHTRPKRLKPRRKIKRQ